jgi:mRNA interferase RelE/StbE
LAYKIEFQRQPYKFLKKLKDNELKLRIKKGIYDIPKDPYKKTKKLQGLPQTIRRIRIGKYRIIFEIDELDCIIIIHEIGLRANVYS